ncbi:hypothetical protein AHAT_41920 [Agarivorans sp. Toyoura001]|uniref:hypothetical protein n=1 Tax=Agarivorans sp. Toyoura001 TaxID=2283141 RepID=UPI0010E22F94|nr:hypothetical protein [Agarivorans sp. Toyoura001]GDY28302.1 hypothetical protein AHAT_41920 [Agarivorans sp. Toyoura001]
MLDYLKKISNQYISMVDSQTGIRISSCVMNTEDFIALAKTNGVQRFTEGRLSKALKNHLKTPFPTHCSASLALLPSGEMVKLDAHTRCEAWEGGYLDMPKQLMVTIYHVDDEQFTRRLYHALDNKNAAETAADHAYGSARGSLERKPINGALFSRRGIRTALEIALNNGASMTDEAFRARLEHSDGRNLIEVLDKHHFKPNLFNAGFLGAIALSILKDGEDAMGFWSKVASGEGTKEAGRLDAVEMAYQFKMDIDRFKSVKASSMRPKDVQNGSSRSINNDYCLRVLPFYQAWKAGRTYQPTPNAKGWTTRSHKSFESSAHFLKA